MKTFSQRYDFRKDSGIQIERISVRLKNRLWNKFNSEIFLYPRTLRRGNNPIDFEKIMDYLGIIYYPQNTQEARDKNVSRLKEYLSKSNAWYVMYDFVEIYVNQLSTDQQQTICKEYNKILEEENSGYRFVNGSLTPIIDEQEIQSIEGAANTKYSVVNTHIEKAIQLFANREHPDYENVIKESISAVESLCAIITDNNQPLGQTLKQLGDKGIKIPQSLQKSMSNLYGYASSEVRHGTSEESEVTFEDAKFILVWCSGFVNYLIGKWEKV